MVLQHRRFINGVSQRHKQMLLQRYAKELVLIYSSLFLYDYFTFQRFQDTIKVADTSIVSSVLYSIKALIRYTHLRG